MAWRQTNDRAFNLIADKDTYSPGDTAEILIAQPFNHAAYALVTYERGHIYRQNVVLLKGNSTLYKLPITEDMAPISYVSVVVVSGAEQSGTPDFKIGMTSIKVNTSHQELDVKVTADKQSAGPGDQVTYTIETKDYDGKPVSADVSLAVVDKAALALAPANSAPILDSFYPRPGAWGSGPRWGSCSMRRITTRNIARAFRQVEAAVGEAGRRSLGIITVRQNFKDTAFFRGQVTTDQDGRAKLTRHTCQRTSPPGKRMRGPSPKTAAWVRPRENWSARNRSLSRCRRRASLWTAIRPRSARSSIIMKTSH